MPNRRDLILRFRQSLYGLTWGMQSLDLLFGVFLLLVIFNIEVTVHSLLEASFIILPLGGRCAPFVQQVFKCAMSLFKHLICKLERFFRGGVLIKEYSLGRGKSVWINWAVTITTCRNNRLEIPFFIFVKVLSSCCHTISVSKLNVHETAFSLTGCVSSWLGLLLLLLLLCFFNLQSLPWELYRCPPSDLLGPIDSCVREP